MNWSVIILGLVALSSVAIAENSYLVIVPKLLKVGYGNQFSVFIAAASQPVQVKFELTVGQQRVVNTTTINPGVTTNATLTLPTGFPVGAGELTVVGTGGVTFEEKRDVIVYDSQYVVLVQTAASTYRPGDKVEVRVVVTNEQLVPVEDGELTVELYDANLKLVGNYDAVPIRSGLTETVSFRIDDYASNGAWLVSATIGNTTSSVQVLVARPITPSFDLKAIFQRFLLRTDKNLRGVIEIDDDENKPIFGRAIVAVGPVTEEDVQNMMVKQQQLAQQQQQQQGKVSQEQQPIEEQWRKWKSQQVEIAGRVEINYDLMSLFNIDVSKVLAVQVYIQVTDLASGQERFIEHIIPVFTRDVVYDIRPLEFEAGCKNEYEILARRPDGKPAKLENVIVTAFMIIGDEEGKVKEEKQVEIKDFYTRGRNDIGLFNVELPPNVIGVLMRITPLSEDGQVRGYRTHAVPLMPTPRRGKSGGKLSIELLPATTSPVPKDGDKQVVSSQIATVGRTSNFYIQLIPTGSVTKVEPLPVSYVLLTNGRITYTGEFTLQPTIACKSKVVRTVEPEVQGPPACVFNGTLPIEVTGAMIPYSTLLVYTFQPSFGFNVAEAYRFSVAGLFKTGLTLNATVIPYSEVATELLRESESFEDFSSEEIDLSKANISPRAQDKSRVQLSFTGTPGATVGLNVFEYDGILQGLSNEITRERVLRYLTAYEQVPIVGMPASREGPNGVSRRMVPPPMPPMAQPGSSKRVVSEEDEALNIEQEQAALKIRYPIEKMIFGIISNGQSTPVEGDDAYVTSNLGRLYGNEQSQQTQSPYRRRLLKQANQYDVSVGENEVVIATSVPVALKNDAILSQQQQQQFQKLQQEKQQEGQDDEEVGQRPQYGTPSWYEKASSKLNTITQEAFTFMQTGLSVITDFPSLSVPVDMRRSNLTKLFARFRQQSLLVEPGTFSVRDEGRQLLEEYLTESDLSMVPPPIVIEEQARNSYYQSILFNTSVIGSQGTGKVVLPRTKPYSTWVASAFALSGRTGLSVAQPIGLPTNQGLYILGELPTEVRVGEHVLLTYGVNNYLTKDVSNVIVRIRASADFDLIEQSQPERVQPGSGKDYTYTIPSLKSLEIVTRNIVLVPKREGIVKILLEVESEFGGDYEVLTTFVGVSGITRRELSLRLYNLTAENKSYGPIVERITQSPSLRSVRISVSGTGLDQLISRNSFSTNSLVGVDRAIISLWRLLGLREYLNDTMRIDTPLFNATVGNISLAYQRLQTYNSYNGSYSFINDIGEQQSSLYLTTLALGALMSPLMPVRDNVTLNRTLSWVLSQQREDGSFENSTTCFHYRFCADKFRRESLTALVLYTLTRDNVTEGLPRHIVRPLLEGERSPVRRAQQYLLSRLGAVKSCLLTTTLVELALLQSPLLPAASRQEIFRDVTSRSLTVVPEIDGKYIQTTDEKYTADDKLLINAMTLLIYGVFGDYPVVSAMSRYVVSRIEVHPHYDTLLDGIFITGAWLKSAYLCREHFNSEKYAVVVDVTADNGQKHRFLVNSTNVDLSQKFVFTLPVNQITYTVSGEGAVVVYIRQLFVEKQQNTTEPAPYQVNTEFLPMPWLNEITSRTCVTYTPTAQSERLADASFNRTVVVEVELPSGVRVNLRQIGFFVSRVPEVVYFTFNERTRQINFFLNIPQAVNGKQICFEWVLERLSYVAHFSPIVVRAYDYLQPEIQVARLFPIEFKPDLLGYSFVDAVHQARPTLEQLKKQQDEQIKRLSTAPSA